MFEILNPWILLLLPLPWLVRKLFSPISIQNKTALRVPFFKQLLSLTQVSRQTSSVQRMCLAYLIWSLLIFAVSGPVWLGTPVDLRRSGRDIILAIDISGSMEIPDMELHGHAVDRLQIVKKVAREFIEKRAGDRLGLILFGSRSYLLTPLTFDLKTVRSMLDDASIGLAGPQTALGDAIGLAIKHLKNYPKDSRVIILLTDGVNNAGHVFPLDAAKMAAEYGIKIYTIGLGAGQMLTSGFSGPEWVNPSTELDEATLQKIAKTTQGLYFRATNHPELAKIYRHLNKLEPHLGEKEIFRPKTQLYPWPLGLALLLSLIFGISTSYFKKQKNDEY